ncbi:MAG: hypothetical protein AUK43_12605 [Oscillatoriales cyanobacterium CG2_30_40_61]|nr:MAG: hypothetical protein AUK43_12605 [Oscillatoriales cyanobacterium CG2_30_40_61]
MLDTSYIEKTTGFSETTIKLVVQGLIDFIEMELRAGNEVKIRDFGVFYPKELGERKSRNLGIGETITVKPVTKPKILF